MAKTDHGSSDNPRVTIVIVTYRSRDLIARCLDPIASRDDFQIIVWENASGDGTADFVRANYPRVQVFESQENLGFARGNNAAFRHARGDFILALNPDAFLANAGDVDTLVNWLEQNEGYAACGPQLIHHDGRHQVGDAGWRISLLSVAVHSLMLQRILPFLPSLYLTSRHLRAREKVDVDWVCGACMLMGREIIEQLGGFADDVFMYGEDIDLGTRMADAGWKTAYLPQTKVLHLQGGSQGAASTIFASTKWLDDIVDRYGERGSSAGFYVMKMTIMLGYYLRAGLQWPLGLVTGRRELKERARISADFAQYARKLRFQRKPKRS